MNRKQRDAEHKDKEGPQKAGCKRSRQPTNVRLHSNEQRKDQQQTFGKGADRFRVVGSKAQLIDRKKNEIGSTKTPASNGSKPELKLKDKPSGTTDSGSPENIEKAEQPLDASGGDSKIHELARPQSYHTEEGNDSHPLMVEDGPPAIVPNAQFIDRKKDAIGSTKILLSPLPASNGSKPELKLKDKPSGTTDSSFTENIEKAEQPLDASGGDSKIHELARPQSYHTEEGNDSHPLMVEDGPPAIVPNAQFIDRKKDAIGSTKTLLSPLPASNGSKPKLKLKDKPSGTTDSSFTENIEKAEQPLDASGGDSKIHELERPQSYHTEEGSDSHPLMVEDGPPAIVINAQFIDRKKDAIGSTKTLLSPLPASNGSKPKLKLKDKPSGTTDSSFTENIEKAEQPLDASGGDSKIHELERPQSYHTEEGSDSHPLMVEDGPPAIVINAQLIDRKKDAIESTKRLLSPLPASNGSKPELKLKDKPSGTTDSSFTENIEKAEQPLDASGGDSKIHELARPQSYHTEEGNDSHPLMVEDGPPAIVPNAQLIDRKKDAIESTKRLLSPLPASNGSKPELKLKDKPSGTTDSSFTENREKAEQPLDASGGDSKIHELARPQSYHTEEGNDSHPLMVEDGPPAIVPNAQLIDRKKDAIESTKRLLSPLPASNGSKPELKLKDKPSGTTDSSFTENREKAEQPLDASGGDSKIHELARPQSYHTEEGNDSHPLMVEDGPSAIVPNAQLIDRKKDAIESTKRLLSPLPASNGSKPELKLKDKPSGTTDSSFTENIEKAEQPLDASGGDSKIHELARPQSYHTEEGNDSHPLMVEDGPPAIVPNAQLIDRKKDSIGSTKTLLSPLPASNGSKPKLKLKDKPNGTTDSSFTGFIHRVVLNRCMPELVYNLNFETVCDYILQKELLPGVKLRDISELKTTSEKVRALVGYLQQQPYSIYKKFKECLNLSKQSHLRKLLEEREATVTEDDIKQEEESSCKDIIKQLQDNLIAAYRSLRAIQVSPSLEVKCDLKNVYVDLVIQEDDKRKEIGGETGNNLKRSDSKMMKDVTRFKQIFFDKDGRSRLNRIYLCGKGGFGKTTFCRKVLHTWCNVKQNIKDDKTSVFQDSDVLRMFDILFYINVREISDEKDLIQVICAQWPLTSCPDKNFISSLLDQHKDKVLFILDGLDELPRKAKFMNDVVKRKLYPKCCFFISSNTGQIYQMQLNEDLEIDLMLHLQGFSDTNAIQCAENILKTCYSDALVIDKFEKDIKDNRLIKELIHVPLLLLILVHTWYENNRSLPKKIHEIYISLFGLLADRFQRKYKNDPAIWQMKMLQNDHISSLPGNLSDLSVLKMFGEGFLGSLSNGAHHFLLMNNKENSLVFEEKEVLVIFGNDGRKTLDLALGLGLISVIESVSYISRNTKLCFLHKTMQEFFTAVCLMRNPNKLNRFVSSLTNLDDVLQSENIIVFLVGLSSLHGNQVLEKVCELCNDDKEVVQYRKGWFVPSGRPESLMEMYKRCMEEVKGVCLNVSDLSHTEFDVRSLQPKLCKSLDLTIQISNSSEILDLRALTKLCRLSLRYFSDSKVQLPTSGPLIAPVLRVNAPLLTVIYIKGPLHQCLFDLSDTTLTHCTVLKTLVLNNTDLQTFQLDLSKLTVLSELKLCKVTLSRESCYLLGMTLTHCTQLNLLQLEETDLYNFELNLSKMTVLSQLILRGVKLSSSCCHILGSTLTHCTKLRTLRLEDTDLHNCQLDLSNMRKLSELKLMKVIVSKSGKDRIEKSLTELESLNIFRKINTSLKYSSRADRWVVCISKIYIPVNVMTGHSTRGVSARTVKTNVCKDQKFSLNQALASCGK